MKFAFVFPGQGSQFVGMLDSWADNSVIKDIIDRSSMILKSDLKTLISKGPEKLLNLTVNTQPAMFATSLAFFSAWQEAGGIIPTVMAGHSLGEYAALAAAGVFSLEDGVKLVETRARAAQNSISLGNGCMAVIIGLNSDALNAICVENAQNEIVEIANFNAPEQQVVSGHSKAVERVCSIAKLKGAKHILYLPISAPFHSSLLRPASYALASALESISLNIPKIDVVNNVDVSIEKDPNAIRDALIRQIWKPVRWMEILEFLKKKGITHVVECGPGKVLSGLIKRMNLGMIVLSISDPDSLRKVISKINTDLFEQL